jgi:hypothetical protein
MQYAGLELTIGRSGDYSFADQTLAATHHGRHQDHAKREAFIARHELKRSKSRKHPEWLAILPPGLLKFRGLEWRYPSAPAVFLESMKRLRDHVALFHRNGAYVFTTQPYTPSLESYQVIEEHWRSLGLYIDISYRDAWWYPGRTPLIIISQIPIELTKL